MFRLHMIFKSSSDNTNMVQSVQEIIFGTIPTFQLAIIAPRINLIGYDTATVQS